MSKKAKARIARRLEKQLKDKEKSVRLREEPGRQCIRSEYAQEEPKAARAGANPGSVFGMRMRWTIETADKEGEWSWRIARDWGDETWEQDLQPKLQEFAKLTWAEIEAQTYGNEGKRHRMHHSMDTDQICNEARDRLNELARDPDILFRFRLGNKPRLWGVRIVDQFEVYWYDPTHQIYPVD